MGKSRKLELDFVFKIFVFITFLYALIQKIQKRQFDVKIHI